MVLGDAVTKLQRFVWIFNHVSRVITWSLFNFRAPNLFKKPISTWPFIWWCQFIDWFEFETRPSSLRNSEMANKAVSSISSPLGMFREEREGRAVLAGYLSHWRQKNKKKHPSKYTYRLVSRDRFVNWFSCLKSNLLLSISLKRGERHILLFKNEP